MLARIAQELFWLGRDLTRAEHTARMLDGAFHADVAGGPGERGIALSWEAVLEIIGAKPAAIATLIVATNAIAATVAAHGGNTFHIDMFSTVNTAFDVAVTRLVNIPGKRSAK